MKVNRIDGMTEFLKAINTGLSFLLELAMLLAFGYWGFYGDKSIALKWILGIGLPLIIAVIWGMFFAPNAAKRLNGTNGTLLSLLLFLLSAVALFYAQHSTLAIVFALTAIANRVLILVWKQW
jgi:hypothetical protein